MSRPKLLDLFCGAGGCAMGYHRAGFDVIGVDINPQKRYPFDMQCGDALSVLATMLHGMRVRGHKLEDFAAIHASPPCQRYSVARQSDNHPDLVPATRELLRRSGLLFVIENVEGAPMDTPMTLCGSMFGLLVRRHRLFESNILLMSPGGCRHKAFKGDYPCGRSNGTARAGERSKVVHVYGQGCSRGDRGLWQKAMQIDWMTMNEMAQAIPPAYTEFIGKQLLEAIR